MSVEWPVMYLYEKKSILYPFGVEVHILTEKKCLPVSSYHSCSNLEFLLSAVASSIYKIMFVAFDFDVKITGWGLSNATEDLNRSEENINYSAPFFPLKMVTLDLPKTHATIGMVIRS